MYWFGFDDQVDLCFQDYCDIEESFDVVVLIEMFEVVGVEYWDVYFDKFDQVMKFGVCVLLQVIIICDCDFDGYFKLVDFIQKYVFFGGMLFINNYLYELGEKYVFKLINIYLFGCSYVEIFWCWYDSYIEVCLCIELMGFDYWFDWIWCFYFVYCEVGFDMDWIDVGQFIFVKLD